MRLRLCERLQDYKIKDYRIPTGEWEIVAVPVVHCYWSVVRYFVIIRHHDWVGTLTMYEWFDNVHFSLSLVGWTGAVPI